MNHLYNEDRIIDIRDVLDSLMGKIVMDHHDDLFYLKDYYIESTTRKVSWFSKKTETVFYIKYITLSSGSEDFKHDQDDDMCSSYGVSILMEMHENWTRLQKKLIQFSIASGVPLNFSGMSKV